MSDAEQEEIQDYLFFEKDLSCIVCKGKMFQLFM